MLSKTRKTSPLAEVKENVPPMLFTESAPSPLIPRNQSNMRRSNTYTKMNLSNSPESNATNSRPHRLNFSPSPQPSPASSSNSEADNTVIECTQSIIEETAGWGPEKTCGGSVGDRFQDSLMTATKRNRSQEDEVEYIETLVIEDLAITEIVETVTTEVRETVTLIDGVVQNIDKEEIVTQVEEQENGKYSHQSYYYDTHQSMVNPNFATFIKSPDVKTRIMSETCVLSRHGDSLLHPMSQTRVLDPRGESEGRLMSETRVLTPDGKRDNAMSETQVITPRLGSVFLHPDDESILSPLRQSLAPLPDIPSPRRFFLDLLSNKRPGANENGSREHQLLASDLASNTEAASEPVVASGNPTIIVPNPSNQPSNDTTDGQWNQGAPGNIQEHFERIPSPESTRRFSTLTVTKNKPSTQTKAEVNMKILPCQQTDLRISGSPDGARGGRKLFQASPSDLSVSPTPLASPLASSDTNSNATPSPEKSPHKMKIIGTTYAFSRTPRKLVDSPVDHTPSPEKQRKSRASRRRSSGRFKHSSVGKKSTPRKDSNETEESLTSAQDTGTNVCGSGPPQRSTQAGRATKTTEKKPPPKPLPNYLKTTSSTARRRALVTESMKKGAGTEGCGGGSRHAEGVQKETMPKKAKRDEGTSGSVVSSLTRAQQLRRQGIHLLILQRSHFDEVQSSCVRRVKPFTLMHHKFIGCKFKQIT